MKYLAIFVLALVGTLVATPWARRAALRFDIVDRPGGRKAHHAPMPYLGGLAIYVGFMLFLIAIVLKLSNDTQTSLAQGLAIIAGATLMVVLGLIDDRFALPPLVKLAGQVLAAALLLASGIHFHFNHFSWLDYPVSMLWVLGITNAFNLLDNMDGLSTGVAAVACGYFFILAELNPLHAQFVVASMAAALCGACLGFLYYNFNPARIFMGDAGALFLGFMLSAVALKIDYTDFSNLHAINILVPIVVLGIPVFDTTLVTISRLRRHVPVSRGGRDHTSHRLVMLGLTVREAVMTVYIAAGALGIVGILLTIVKSIWTAYATFLLLLLLGVAAGYQLEQVYLKKSLQPATPGDQLSSEVSGQTAAISNQSARNPQPSAISNQPARSSQQSAVSNQPAAIGSHNPAGKAAVSSTPGGSKSNRKPPASGGFLTFKGRRKG